MMRGLGSLRQQVALVTGGSQGIGLSICKALASEGASVAVVSRRQEAVDAVSKDLPVLDDAQRHTGFSCDIRSSEQVNDLVPRIESQLGPLSILVNAAGINHDSLLMRLRDQDIQDIFQTNVYGAMHTCRAASKFMIRRKSGVIVNIGSVSAQGNIGQSAYSASKAALEGFTKSVAKELGSRGIRANLIAPGFVETEMTARLRSSDADKSGAGVWDMDRIALGRFAKPEEIAQVVTFLCTSGGSYITGQVIRVDGGLAI